MYKNEMNKKTFEPKKYGMDVCPSCNGVGYIENPERQCCPKCGGFGFVKTKPETNVKSSQKRVGKEDHREGGGHL